MSELLAWQKKIVEDEKKMSNDALLTAVIEQAQGDDYDGCFTERGRWEFAYLGVKLRERLSDWLKL